MGREINQLSPRFVATAKKPGSYPDGGNLYLQIKKQRSGPGINKSWLFRFMLNGTARYMGLGSLKTVSLSEAREAAREARKLVMAGVDPIEQRNRERAEAAANSKSTKTFKWCAEQYIRAHSDSWKNDKHRQQWENTLSTYAYPKIGTQAVDLIDTNDIIEILEPMWKTKTETAKRLRGRIENVLDWAAVRKFRSGENPARWRGHMDKLLPSPAKVQKVKHHEALPYTEIGAFMQELRKREELSARALEFLILTATRTGEVIGAKWDEFDLKAGVWTIPAGRMKARREHRVPLGNDALQIIKDLTKIDGNDHIFPGQRVKRPLSNMSLLKLMDRMSFGDFTAHGFRSSFRDWCAETTNFPREVAEAALAHGNPDKVEAAYQRGDFFDKRRKLMEAWSAYCAKVPKTGGNVTPIRRRAGA